MGLSALFFPKIALKPMRLLINHEILLTGCRLHAHGEAVLLLAACYLGKNSTLPLSEIYTVYKIAV